MLLKCCTQYVRKFGKLSSGHRTGKGQFSFQSQSRAAVSAAKSLQSCPTLCDPIDSSLPGSPIPGILQARILEWLAISFSKAWKWKVKVKSFSCVRLLATPWTAAYAKECSNYHTIALISHTSKVILKILQARLQQYINWEIVYVQAGFRKGRGTRNQIASICWIIEKAREFQKNIYFCFIDYTKAFDCVDNNKLWKILQDVGLLDHLICLPRSLYTGQEAPVRTRHGTIDWFQNGKGVRQGCMLSPCLFNLYAEYIMWNIRMDEAQAGIKIARRNISNFRYAADTTLMAEIKEELKNLLMKVKDNSERLA